MFKSPSSHSETLLFFFHHHYEHWTSYVPFIHTLDMCYNGEKRKKKEQNSVEYLWPKSCVFFGDFLNLVLVYGILLFFIYFIFY